MTKQGGGRIINVSVGGGSEHHPSAPPGEGGWGVLYGMVKAAQYRIPGLVRVEYPNQNILCFSMNPGFVKTPVIAKMPIFESAEGGIPPSLPGTVIVWLATSDEAEKYCTHPIDAVPFAKEHNIVPSDSP